METKILWDQTCSPNTQLSVCPGVNTGQGSLDADPPHPAPALSAESTTNFYFCNTTFPLFSFWFSRLCAELACVLWGSLYKNVFVPLSPPPLPKQNHSYCNNPTSQINCPKCKEASDQTSVLLRKKSHLKVFTDVCRKKISPLKKDDNGE